MIYILFSNDNYKIVAADITGKGNAQNGRPLTRLRIHKTIEDCGFSNILFTNHPGGEISYLESDMFEIKDTKKIIDYIFTKMMVDWWER